MAFVVYLLFICPLMHAIRHDYAAIAKHATIVLDGHSDSFSTNASAFVDQESASTGAVIQDDSKTKSSLKNTVGPPIVSRAEAVQHFGGTSAYGDYVSWARFAAVMVIGEGDWREKIARVALGATVSAHVTFGPAFSFDYTFDGAMLPYLQSTISSSIKTNLVFFTATDPATVGTPTHFISYVLDRRTPALYVFNPAVGPRGIQDPAYKSAMEEKLTNFYKKANVPVHFWPVTTAPQVTESDVFCQTWSLILAIEGMRQLSVGTANAIAISSRIGERRQMLLSFWQNLLAIPGFPNMLENSYTKARREYGNTRFDKKDQNEATHLLKFAEVRDAF